MVTDLELRLGFLILLLQTHQHILVGALHFLIGFFSLTERQSELLEVAPKAFDLDGLHSSRGLERLALIVLVLRTISLRGDSVNEALQIAQILGECLQSMIEVLLELGRQALMVVALLEQIVYLFLDVADVRVRFLWKTVSLDVSGSLYDEPKGLGNETITHLLVFLQLYAADASSDGANRRAAVAGLRSEHHVVIAMR